MEQSAFAELDSRAAQCCLPRLLPDSLSLKGSEWDADVSFQPKVRSLSLSQPKLALLEQKGGPEHYSFACQCLSLALSILSSQRETLIYGQCALDQRSCCQRAPFFYFNATEEFLFRLLKHSHIFLKFAPFFFKGRFPMVGRGNARKCPINHLSVLTQLKSRKCKETTRYLSRCFAYNKKYQKRQHLLRVILIQQGCLSWCVASKECP